MTTSWTELSAIAGVREAAEVTSNASLAVRLRPAPTIESQSESKLLDFFKMIFATSRTGGVCFRFSFIFRWATGEVAWFGGECVTEKKPGECPVRRLIATIRIHSSTASSFPFFTRLSR